LEAHVYSGAHHDFDGGTASGTATIGTHPAAREDSLRRVPEFLARMMPAR
jgi:dienelactone hydrolase